MGDRKRSRFASRRRSGREDPLDRFGGPVVALIAGDPAEMPELLERRHRAMPFLEGALARAEEMYLVDPDATLGTWFARVSETLAVASRVILKWIDEDRNLEEKEVVREEVGLFADIYAEAIRAASRAQGKERATQVRKEVIEATFACPLAVMDSSWNARLGVLAKCTVTLEPLACGLREGDLPMNEPTDCERVGGLFMTVAVFALHVVESHFYE